MKKIIDNLYLGDMHSVPSDSQFVLSCSQEIFERFTKNKVKDEYVWDGNKRLLLNLMDYPSLEDLDINLIKLGLDEMKKALDANKKVYVHCIFGVNRSASMVFMYLVCNNYLKGKNYREAQDEFWSIYDNHSPNPGWKQFLIKNYPYNF